MKNGKSIHFILFIASLCMLLLMVFGGIWDGKEVYAFTESNPSEEVLEEAEKWGLTKIYLEQDNSQVSGQGAVICDNVIKIYQRGLYYVNGNLEDGQILIEAENHQEVILVLAGVSVTCPEDAAVYIKNGNARIWLEENTENILQSGSGSEVYDEEASGGALYGKADLTITGSGSLRVYGYLNNGIHASGNLTIENGTIEVDAVHHGVKGKENVMLTGGTVVVRAGGDGMKSEGDVTVSGGGVTVLEAEEGLEGKNVFIEGGVVNINAKDDGINASDGSGGGFGNFGGSEKKGSGEELPVLCISGGCVTVNAMGDGLDSNGDIIIEGGVTIVNGPESNGDGALDSGAESGGRILLNGGTVLALGSSGMAETFEEDSEQCSFFKIWEESYGAGDEIVITDADGTELFRHTAEKTGNSVVFGSPKLKQGSTYTLSVNEESVEVELTDVSTADERMGMHGFPGGGPDGFGGGRGPQMPEGAMPEGMKPGEMPPEGMEPGEMPPEGLESAGHIR